MPQQTDSATRTRICRVGDFEAGQKLRLAGRVLSYDVKTGLIILVDEKHGLLVDVILSLDQNQSRLWATERLSTVIAMPLTIPAVPSYAPPIEIDQNLVLRAILLVPSPDLDLNLWNAVLMEEENEDRQPLTRVE
ncbi:hypothetical protein CVT26_000306 [Gymnopilus dilepis]|uniref:Uncharacterized protein n=1 Tax=Gymnopilus dilepis TaxID=231916 RepID=A0A409VHC6_9AGAR|nr:hypothetical protein CVT26_000306 [Gymnopilus dilepis]